MAPTGAGNLGESTVDGTVLPFMRAGFGVPPCLEVDGEQDRPIARTKGAKPSARRHAGSTRHLSTT